MALDDIYTALDRFKAGVSELAMQRTINGANDAVYQIRNSELKDEDKVNQLRGVAEQLTYHLASQGVPATTMEALTKYIPAQKRSNTIDEGIISGTPEERDRAYDLLHDKSTTQMNLLNAKMEAMQNMAATRAEAAGNKAALGADKETDKRFDSFGKLLLPDEKAKNAFSQSALIKQNSDRLKALIGNDLSDDHLNKIAPQFVTEAASALARQVTGGVPGKEIIGEFVPANIAMDEAKAKAYLTNKMEGAGAADFIRNYYKAANREAAVADSAIEESVLKRAQIYADLYGKDSTRFRSILSSNLPGTKPEDFTVNEKGQLRFVPAQRRESKYNKLLEGIPLDLKVLNDKTADPKAKSEVLQRWKNFGLSPDMTMKEIKTHIQYVIRSQGE